MKLLRKFTGYHRELTDRDHKIVGTIAPGGYLVAVNFTHHGAEYLSTNYSDEWVKEYEDGAYMWYDPVVLYAMAKKGSARWSAIKLMDVAGVLKKGKKHGLNFGVVISRRKGRGRSVFSAARDDREFFDEEIDVLSSWLDVFLEKYFVDPSIGKKQLEALSLAAEGCSVAEAARLCGCSEPAMKARLKSARDVLGAKTTAQAVAIAISKKLL